MFIKELLRICCVPGIYECTKILAVVQLTFQWEQWGWGTGGETDKKLNKSYHALEGNKDMEKESVDWSVDGEIVVFNMVVRVGIIEKVTLE